MKKLLIILLFTCTSATSAAEKHALIIAIGDYPSGSGWGDISSKNDIPLIEQALLSHNFRQENIFKLVDEKATYKGIKNAFTNLITRLNKGDVVVVHFSGHGQPIWDTNNDEIDGYDEAWIPYDARATFDRGYYEGKNHLRDDELGDIFILIRNKLGKEGQLVVVMDSCHSGTATRGNIGGLHRGSFVPFQPRGYNPIANDKDDFAIIDRIKTSEDIAPYIAISGATAGELNYEYKGIGSLSFAFSEAMASLPGECTYRKLFSMIEAKMNIIAPTQQPTIEGDGIDFEIFKNKYVKQQPYFPLTKFVGNRKVLMQGGVIHHLHKNTTLLICEAGTSFPTEKNILTKGIITNARLNESEVELETNLGSSNEKNYWIFVDKLSFKDVGINVFIDHSNSNVYLRDSISTFLTREKIGELVIDERMADVGIKVDKDSKSILLYGAINSAWENSSRGDTSLQGIKNELQTYSMGKYLKELTLINLAYSFDFKLIPVNFDKENKRPVSLLDEEAFFNSNGAFQVRPEKDYAVLSVTNNGTKPIYFSIVEINSKGEIAAFMPNPSYRLTDLERKLAPGQTKVFMEQAYRFDPPYEKLLLKGFSSNRPLDLSSVYSESTRGITNPLEKFIKGSIQRTRGSGTEVPEEELVGYSFEFKYEIVEE